MPVSILRCNSVQYCRLLTEGTLCGWMACNQGVVLFDDGFLAKAGSDTFVLKRSFQDDIVREYRKLEALRHLERFGSDYHWLLSALFGVFKNISMYYLAELGQPETKKLIAIEKFLTLFPSLRHAIPSVQALQAFSTTARRGPVIPAPFSASDGTRVLYFIDILDEIRRTLHDNSLCS